MAFVPPKQKKQYAQNSDGVHAAVVADVHEPFEEADPFQLPDGKRVSTRLVYITDEMDADDKPITISVKCRLSINPAATLTKHIEAALGETPDEEVGFDLERLIDRQVLLQTRQSPNPKTGIIYARVVNVMPAPPSAKAVRIPIDFQRAKDRPSKPGNGAATKASSLPVTPRVSEKKSQQAMYPN